MHVTRRAVGQKQTQASFLHLTHIAAVQRMQPFGGSLAGLRTILYNWLSRDVTIKKADSYVQGKKKFQLGMPVCTPQLLWGSSQSEAPC